MGQLAQRVDDGQSLDARLRFLHFGEFIIPLVLHCFASVFDRFFKSRGLDFKCHFNDGWVTPENCTKIENVKERNLIFKK